MQGCPQAPGALPFSPTGDLTIPGNLLVKGEIVGLKGLDIKGKATLGSLEVLGDAVFDGNTLTKGNSAIVGNQSIDGNQAVAGDQAIGGDQAVAGEQEVAGDAHFLGNVTVEGLTTLNGGLNVTAGPIDLIGDVTIEGDIEILGDVNVDGRFTVNGLPVSPEIYNTFTSVNPGRNYIVPTEFIADKHKFKVLERQLNGAVTIDDPFATAPIGTIANPPGTLTLGILDFKIVNASTVAPWYFGPAGVDPQFRYIDDDPNQIVLRAGLPEIFTPIYNPDNLQPPGDNTVTQIDITINQPTTTAAMDIFLRGSTEEMYDFAQILLNGAIVYSQSGCGPNVNNPYIAPDVPIPVIFQTGEVVSIVFTKDALGYGGIDMIYFFLRNLEYTNIVAPPANFFIVRGGVIQRNLGLALPLNTMAIGTTRNVFLQFEFQPGDLIAFRPTVAVYSVFRILYIATR